MAITVVGSNNYALSVDTAGSLTGSFSLTNTSGNNRLVVVLAALGDGQVDFANFTGCTFNGVSCTLITSANDTGANKAESAVWRIDDAALPASAGSYDVVVTSDDSGTDEIKMTVVELSGVDQTTPIADSNTATTWTPSASLGLTDYGDLALDIVAANNGAGTAPIFTATSGQTVVSNDSSDVGGQRTTVATSYDTTGPFTWTSTQTPSNSTHIVFSVNAAAAPSYTITSIDGDNDVQAGQSSVSIVTSGIDPASVTQAVTLGGETLTINSWTDSGGNALINVDIPLHINLKWDTTHELAVTHDGGTTTLSGVTLSAPTGWETVSFSTIPDTGTTESFYEYSQSDVTVGNFTAQVGDTLAFTSSTGLTIDGSSIPVVDPAATVTGSYKWWDASLSTWTPVSSYTITNLGVFGGSDTTVMIQEMISDMISEMVN